MRKYFLTGLVTLLPLAITIWVIHFIIHLLTEPFVGVVTKALSQLNFPDFLFLSREEVTRYTSQLLILVSLFFFTLGLGMLTRWFFMHTFLRNSDKILHKIPLVRAVYKTTQDITKTLLASDKNSFKQVVMVPYPQKGTYMIGLIVREAPDACRHQTNEDLYSVLVPTTPNPTTGFLLMYKKQDIIFLDIKPEDAFKYVVSCGAVVPSSTPPRPVEGAPL